MTVRHLNTRRAQKAGLVLQNAYGLGQEGSGFRAENLVDDVLIQFQDVTVLSLDRICHKCCQFDKPHHRSL